MNPKNRLFLLVFLHAVASTIFLYGAPFYAKQKFGWSAGPNLLMQVLSGFCIAVGAYIGGQVAHRTHPRLTIDTTLSACLLITLLGGMTAAQGPVTLLITLGAYAFFQALGWPGIEALLMTGETHEGVQHLVSTFNLTWSLATASAFLCVTPLMDKIGPDIIFRLPALIYVGTVLFFRYGVPQRNLPLPEQDPAILDGKSLETLPTGEKPGRRPLSTQAQNAFRYLGWLANPLGYVAINVIVAYNPTIKDRLGLSLAQTSLWVGLWFYVRTLAFEVLRRWVWWRYRWGFLCAVFALTMASFAGIVWAVSLPMLLLAQVGFGLGVGLCYQSSLFYSMADSNAQGAHGGFHESFIGLGIMLGPLLAFAGARFAPNTPTLPIWLVLGMMTVGLALLIRIGLSTIRTE